MNLRTLYLAGLGVLFPAAVLAQVGHAPQHSPYRDLEGRSELTWSGGYYQASKDPANVSPQSGPMLSAHWEFRLGGPAYLVANVAGVKSERRVINPVKPIAERVLETRNVPLVLGDLGFALNLTGYKSWHSIVPTIGGGVGLGAGFDRPDSGLFRVGFPFLVVARTGIKLAPRGGWRGRIDATNYFSRVRYPESYFTKTGADATVLPVNSPRNLWRRNLGLTLGVTYTYGR